MEKLLKRKRKFLRLVLNILGVGTVGLITSCCKYGYDTTEYNVQFKGVVKSKDSSQTIPNIKVELLNSITQTSIQTDKDGNFVIIGEVLIEEYPRMRFTDIDGNLNGSFEVMDTTLRQSDFGHDLEIQMKSNE